MNRKIPKLKFYRNQNLDNNLITINSMLNVDYASKTKEEFEECLKMVPKINELFISKSKCGTKKEYETIMIAANISLAMAMIERRLGLVGYIDFEKKYV